MLQQLVSNISIVKFSKEPWGLGKSCFMADTTWSFLNTITILWKIFIVIHCKIWDIIPKPACLILKFQTSYRWIDEQPNLFICKYLILKVWAKNDCFKIIGDEKLILQFWSSYNSTVKLLNDYNLVRKFNFFRGINCTIFLKISAIYTTTET